MIEASEVLFLWTETPLHAGGGSTTGAVDLPIQRDRQTGHPIIQASGVKGVLRDHCKATWRADARAAAAAKGLQEDAARTEDEAQAEMKRLDQAALAQADLLTAAVFGPDKDASEYGGALTVSDARILLFPVRSLRGVCAWITCPLALARLRRDLDRCGLAAGFPPLPDVLPAEGTGWVTPGSPVALPAIGPQTSLVLEEYTFPVTANDYVHQVAAWLVNVAEALPGGDAYAFWRAQLLNDKTSHLAILADDDFTALVESATDVAQRITINDDTGTVSNTGLWTEENLPADSLLWNVLHAMPPRTRRDAVPEPLRDGRGGPSAQKVVDVVVDVLGRRTLLQIGGNETVGRGLTRVRHLARRDPVGPGGATPGREAADGTANA